MKVIFINHYGVFGGAGRSMLELIKNLPGTISAFVLTPGGRIEKILSEGHISYDVTLGISKFDHTKVGYYRKWRWLILIREFAFLFPTVYAFLKNRKTFLSADIIHLNENTCVIPLMLCKFLYRKKTVLHCRAVMNTDRTLWRTRLIKKIFNNYADVIISIDNNVRLSIPDHPRHYVIHNGLTVSGKNGKQDVRLVQRLNALGKRKLNLGFVGVLDRNKGIYELMEAVKLCIDEGLDINLLLLGSLPETGKGFIAEILKRATGAKKVADPVKAKVEELGITSYVHTLGFTTDIKTFYEHIDVICFTTYYDAPGRPVFEGALFEKPAILAVSNPQEDSFVANYTGLQVLPKDIQSIKKAIVNYYLDPQLIKTHGRNARDLAEKNFDIKRNAMKVAEVYSQLVSNQ